MKSEIAMAKIAEAELKTVSDYTKILDEVDCPQCKRVIEDIIREEMVHVGEALGNLKRFRPDWKSALEEGEKEGTDLAKAHPLNRPFFKDSIIGTSVSTKDYEGVTTATNEVSVEYVGNITSDTSEIKLP